MLKKKRKNAFLEVEHILSCCCVHLCGEFNCNCLLLHRQCISNIRGEKNICMLLHFTRLQLVRVNKTT